MEVSFPSDTQASQDLTGNSESVTTPNIQAQLISEDLSVSDLKMCLNEFINVEDIGMSTENNSKCDVVMKDNCKESDESNDNLLECTSSVKGLVYEEKRGEDFNTSEANGCNNSVDKCHSPPKSSAVSFFCKNLSNISCGKALDFELFCQTPFKPASAMKGSREKQGIIPPKKLAVTWAPDVYDPIPTSVSHVPSSKNQYLNGRKYRKNKKGGGKSPRGGKGKDKDKKQGKKNGSNTSKFKPVQDDSVASFSEPPETSIINFNVVGTDPFCGSSFLKESVANLHFPVAEATR